MGVSSEFQSATDFVGNLEGKTLVVDIKNHGAQFDMAHSVMQRMNGTLKFTVLQDNRSEELSGHGNSITVRSERDHVFKTNSDFYFVLENEPG